MAMGLKKQVEHIFSYVILAVILLAPWMVTYRQKPAPSTLGGTGGESRFAGAGPASSPAAATEGSTAPDGGTGRHHSSPPPDNNPWWDLLVLLSMLAVFLLVLLMIPASQTPAEEGSLRTRSVRGPAAKKCHAMAARNRSQAK